MAYGGCTVLSPTRAHTLRAHSREPPVTNMTKGEAFSEGPQEASLVSPEEVRKALSVILQSPPFRSSMQIQKVLKFLVLETLAGRGDTLKERNIGASLFERSPD